MKLRRFQQHLTEMLYETEMNRQENIQQASE